MNKEFSDILPAGTAFYGYTLQGLVGRTPQWVTYRATHDLLQNEVLLHEFYPQGCSARHEESMLVLPVAGGESAFMAALEKFGADIQLHARVAHAQICGIRFASSEEGLTFCVQAAPQGAALYAALPANAGETRLRPVLEQALELAQVALDGGLPMSALTPSAFVLEQDGTLQLNLFGAAAPDAAAGYTALECVQQGGRRCNQSAVYTLGAIFYCLVTGQNPPAASARMGRVDPYEPLATRASLSGVYSPGFLESIDKALSLWVEDRWADFGTWCAALNKA